MDFTSTITSNNDDASNDSIASDTKTEINETTTVTRTSETKTGPLTKADVSEPLPSSLPRAPDVTTRLLPPGLTEDGDVTEGAAAAVPVVGQSSATSTTAFGSFRQYSARVKSRRSVATSRPLGQEASERKDSLLENAGSFGGESSKIQPQPTITTSQAQRARNDNHPKDNVHGSETARRRNYTHGSVSVKSEAGSVVAAPTAAAVAGTAAPEKSATPLTAATTTAATDAIVSQGIDAIVVSDVLLPFSEIITPFVTASGGDGDGDGAHSGDGDEAEGTVPSSSSLTPPLIKSAFVTTAPVTSTITTGSTVVEGVRRGRGEGEVRTSQSLTSSVETSFPSSVVVGVAAETWSGSNSPVPVASETDSLVSERAASGEEASIQPDLGTETSFSSSTTGVEAQEQLSVTEINFPSDHKAKVPETSHRFSEKGTFETRTPAPDVTIGESFSAEEWKDLKNSFPHAEDTIERKAVVSARATNLPSEEETHFPVEEGTSKTTLPREDRTVRSSRPTEKDSFHDSEKRLGVKAVTEISTTQQQTLRLRKSTRSKEDKQQQRVEFTAVASTNTTVTFTASNTYTTTAVKKRESGDETPTNTTTFTTATTTTSSAVTTTTGTRNQGDIFLPSSSTRTKKEGIVAPNVASPSSLSVFNYPTTTTLSSQSSHSSAFLSASSSPPSPSPAPPLPLTRRSAATDGVVKGGDVTGARGGGLLASVSIRTTATTAASDGWDVSNNRRFPSSSDAANSLLSLPSSSSSASPPSSPSVSLSSHSSYDVTATTSSENPVFLTHSTPAPPFLQQTSTTTNTTASIITSFHDSPSHRSVSVSPSVAYAATTTKTTPDVPATTNLSLLLTAPSEAVVSKSTPALSDTDITTASIIFTDVPVVLSPTPVSLPWPTTPSSDSLTAAAAAESLESPPTPASVVVEPANSEPNVNNSDDRAAGLSVTSGVFVNSGEGFSSRGADESVSLASQDAVGGSSGGDTNGEITTKGAGQGVGVVVVATVTAEDDGGHDVATARATSLLPTTPSVLTLEISATAQVFTFPSSIPDSVGPFQTDLFPSSPPLSSSFTEMDATTATGVTPSLPSSDDADGAAGGSDATATSSRHLLSPSPSQSPPPPVPPSTSALVSPPPPPQSSDNDAQPSTPESSLSSVQSSSETAADNAPSADSSSSSPTPALFPPAFSSAGPDASAQLFGNVSSTTGSSSPAETSSSPASVKGGGGGSGGKERSTASFGSLETSSAVQGAESSTESSDSGSGSGVVEVTVTGRSVSGLATDSSGEASGDGEVIDSTTATTAISPTPSSAVLCSTGLMVESTASSNGNGSALDVDGGPGVSPLVIALPVCLGIVVLIAIVIAMSLLCFRRKKKKKGKRRRSHDDLWVEPSADRVPDLALPGSPEVAPPSTTPTFTIAAVQSAHTESETQDETLYLVAHDFTAQLDTQMSLTSGDIVNVQEKADNGWWRGEVQGADKSGWFPSSFVVPFTQEGVQTLNPEPAEEKAADKETPKPRISSFLIRKLQVNRSLRDNNSFSLGKLQSSENNASSAAVTRSASTVTPVAPVKLTPPSLTAEDFSASVRGKHYKAMFSYKAAFRGELSLKEGDIILGKERDRNGWMLGKKVHVKEEGWFPAVYVDEVQGDVSVTEPKGESDAGSEKKAIQVDHDVYGLLAANRNKSPDHSWLAIEHRAVKEFTKATSSQMSLRVGDLVHVVEALDSGWWLGCHGDNVGWFPGDYVELLEEKSEATTGSDLVDLDLLPATASFSYHPHLHDADNASSTASKRSSLVSSVDGGDFNQQQQQQHHNNNNNNNNNKSADNRLSRESVLSGGEDGRPKPARRAPKPPLLLNGHNISGTGTLSRNPRPMRPAPAPPSQKTDRTESIGSMDRLGFLSPGMEGKGGGGGSICGGSSVDDGSVVMHRKQRKPKVVRIPKEKVGLDKISSCPAPTAPPPPYCSLSSGSSSVTVTGGDGVGEDSSSSPSVSRHDHHDHDKGVEADNNDGNDVVPSRHSASVAVGAVLTAPIGDVTQSDDVSSGGGDSQSPLLPASERKNGNDNIATGEDDDTDKDVDNSSSQNERFDTTGAAGSPSDDKPGQDVSDLKDAMDDSIFAPGREGDEGSSSTDLLEEMKLLVPSLKDTPNSTIYLDDGSRGAGATEVSRSSRESTPDTVAVVEKSPTLTAPPSSFPESTNPSHQSGDKKDDVVDGKSEAPPVQIQDQRKSPTIGLNLSDGVSPPVAAADSTPRKTEETNNDNKHDSQQNREIGAVAEHKLDVSETFQNPLMSKESITSKSPGVYSVAPPPKYVPPPPGLLDEAEELPQVDDELPNWPSLAPPPPAQELSARTSPTPRLATGIWRFARSGNVGQSAAPKPVKLTKVAPPVLPKTSSLDPSVELEVPPPGSSGRVSKIVHQINRMTSVDEPPQAHQPGGSSRKTSLQSDTSPVVHGENHGHSAAAHVPATTSGLRASSPNLPVNTLPPPPENDLPLPPPPSELFINDTKENHETLANGGPPTSHMRSWSPTGNIVQQGNRTSDPGIATLLLDQDYFVEGEGESSQRAQHGRRRYSSRESTPESAGEGGGHAVTNKPRKKSRAPGPPKVPPPSPPLSSSSKLAQLSVTNKGATEC